MVKVAVIGSRTYCDRNKIEERLLKFLAENSGVLIVTEGAEGADKIAEQAARKSFHILIATNLALKW